MLMSAPKLSYFSIILTVCLAVSLFLPACREERKPPAGALITVGNFTISQEEFAALLKFEAEVNPAFRLSDEGRREFARRLIEKQVLIQEARARKLDEKEVFRQTIQRYWESTLIRDLLNAKGEAIRQATVVTDEEIAAWYQAHKDNLAGRSLPEQRDDIRKIVENEKVSAAMDRWMAELHGKTPITVAEPDLLRQEAAPTGNAPATKAADTPMEVR